MAKATDPIVIGKRTAKNRITMAPTVKFIAGEDGRVTEDFVAHYALRAKHECAFICVEATCITPEGRLAPTQLGLWEDGQIEGHKRLTDACHEYGALVVPQIHHGGVGTHPACGSAVGPSAMVRESFGRKQEVRGLSREDIRRIVGLFADAAVRAQKAGYDGVQLHACHSYLINDFASALNQREDEYGGSAVNRARFGCEVSCFMSDADVAAEAKRLGVTRARVSMDKGRALAVDGEKSRGKIRGVGLVMAVCFVICSLLFGQRHPHPGAGGIPPFQRPHRHRGPGLRPAGGPRLHRSHPLRCALSQVPELPGLRLRPHPQPPLPRHGGEGRRRIPLSGTAGKQELRRRIP